MSLKFGIPMKVCHCLTLFKNNSVAVMHIHFYFIKVLAFPRTCVMYVVIIIQVDYYRKKHADAVVCNRKTDMFIVT